jgi:predicted Rossmann fold nucleotide-binding protein DprA/Smf involved in DNA uptake
MIYGEIPGPNDEPKTLTNDQLWGDPMDEEDDICENRHGGNAESRDAFSQVEPKIGDLHEQLLRALASRDLTSKELVRVTGLRYTTVSARLSELKLIGRIATTGARREGAAVITLVKGSRYRATEGDLF